MYANNSRSYTVRAPLTHSEIEDTSYDTLFLIVELSDAIRRGVSYFSVSGDPLPDLNDVLNALVSDGEVSFDDGSADDPVAH